MDRFLYSAARRGGVSPCAALEDAVSLEFGRIDAIPVTEEITTML